MRGEEKPELTFFHIGKLGQSGSLHEMAGSYMVDFIRKSKLSQIM